MATGSPMILRTDNCRETVLHERKRHHGINDDAVIMRKGEIRLRSAEEHQKVVAPEIGDEDDDATR